jgi:addiction module HigA family antidote
MIPTHRVPTHPGEILQDEFLDPLGLTQVKLAEHIGVSVQNINAIIRGKRGVTPETAWLFAQAFGTTPQFWVNLQANHDLASAHPARSISRLRKADIRNRHHFGYGL